MTATSFAVYGTSWNIQIHLWLKYYVMLRLMDRSKAKGATQLAATVATFVASSVWHGIYPGYIFCFVGFAMMEIQAKNLPRLKLAQALSKYLPGFLFTLLNYFWAGFQLAYLGLAFVFLTFEKFNLMHRNLNYSVVFLIPLVTLFSLYMPKVRSTPPSDQTKIKTK